MVVAIQRHNLRDFDWLLALLAVCIVAFGTMQIRNAQPTQGYWIKQLIGLGVGLVAMLAPSKCLASQVAGVQLSPAEEHDLLPDRPVSTLDRHA